MRPNPIAPLPRGLALAAALPLLATGCGQVLFAQVDAPAVTVTRDGVAIPALPAGLPLALAIPLDLSPALPGTAADVTTDVRLTGLSTAIQAGSALADLGAVQGVTVTAEPPPGGAVAATRVCAYTRPSPAPSPAPTSLALACDGSIDLSAYLASGALTLAFSATVDPGVSLPSWTAAVTGDFSVTIRADYGKLLR